MEKTGWVGLGVVIRDHQGNMVAAKSLTRTGLLEAVTAEAVAALMAIQISHDLGYSKVWFEGDAKIIVDAVVSNETDWSRKGHLVDDIRVDLKRFTHWKLSYVRWGANQVAHLLAKLATRQKIEKLWTSVPPDCIAETIGAEQQSILLCSFD
jgi:ribonuclease HI